MIGIMCQRSEVDVFYEDIKHCEQIKLMSRAKKQQQAKLWLCRQANRQDTAFG